MLEGAPAEASGSEADAVPETASLETAASEAAPVLDEQGDVEEAFAEAVVEAAEEPTDADILEAALGHRTDETIVAENEDDDEAPFTDDELAELALAADDVETGPEPEAAPEPEKKGFWKRFFE